MRYTKYHLEVVSCLLAWLLGWLLAWLAGRSVGWPVMLPPGEFATGTMQPSVPEVGKLATWRNWTLCKVALALFFSSFMVGKRLQTAGFSHGELAGVQTVTRKGLMGKST